jgi:hypothetical protein
MEEVSIFINQPALVKSTNQLGTILSVNAGTGEAMVDFGAEGQTIFSSDALLVLRDAVDIRRDAKNDVTLMPNWDYYDIMEIVSLAESADMAYRRHAIQLSVKSPEAMEYTMSSLRDELHLERPTQLSRYHGRNT